MIMNKEIYVEYVDCYLGTIEITCDDKYLRKLTMIFDRKDVRGNRITNIVKNQVEEYFNGNRTKFDVPIEFSTSFSDRVYKKLYETEYSKTISYKELASKVSANASRAVGAAMAKNPYFLIVP